MNQTFSANAANANKAFFKKALKRLHAPFMEALPPPERLSYNVIDDETTKVFRLCLFLIYFPILVFM